MSVSENDRDHCIWATTYFWVLVSIMVALSAAILAPAISVIEIMILVMLVSTPLIFLLYVHYGVKVITWFGYMAIGADSWEETWQIFPNLCGVQASIWACIWPIVVYLLRIYLLLPVPTNTAYLQVTNHV